MDWGDDMEAFLAWRREHPLREDLGRVARSADAGTGHEVYSERLRTHVPIDVEPGLDPGLFWNGSDW
jgi:hypothetical protein